MHVRSEKRRRNFGSTTWCIVCTLGTQLRNGYDEDIASSDTTINGQQGPMTRARAHQLNYQE